MSHQPDERPLLSIANVAKIMSVCPHTVRRWIKRGELPVVRLNSRIHRIRPADLERFVNAASPAGSALFTLTPERVNRIVSGTTGTAP